MDSPTLILTELPELTDESAGHIHSFLNAFETAFEEKYYTQLRRYYQLHAMPEPPEPWEPSEDDLFEGFDEIPF
jgi:hypothetical protein